MILDMRPMQRGETDRITIHESFPPRLPSGVEPVGDAEVTGEVTDQAGYMHLVLQVRVPYKTLCARCLDPVAGTFEVSLERTAADEKTLSEKQLEENVDEYAVIRDGMLDLDELVEERRKCARAFIEVLDGCRFLKVQKTPAGVENSYWTVAAELDQRVVTWKDFQQEFLRNGGDGFYGAWRLAYQEPFFARHFSGASCPAAEKLQRNMIQFKTHYSFAEEMPRQLEALKAVIAKYL